MLRVDLSGLGDSPLRPGRRPDVAYSPDTLADISDLVQAVSPAGPSGVALMGLCSGAYPTLSLPVPPSRARGVLAINPVWPTGQAGRPVRAPGSPGPAAGAPGSAGSPGPAAGTLAEATGGTGGPMTLLSGARGLAGAG